MKKEMKLKEFKEKYMGKNSKWDWAKFSIVCNKCQSNKIEFNGYLEIEQGYYEGEESLEGAIIVKCHSCGNAFRIDTIYDDELELNTGAKKSIKR